MTLCLADSILHCGGFSPRDARLRLHNWVGAHIDVCQAGLSRACSGTSGIAIPLALIVLGQPVKGDNRSDWGAP
jgi:hypothetical protein